MNKILFGFLSIMAITSILTIQSCGNSSENELKFIECENEQDCYSKFNEKWRGKTMKEFSSEYGESNIYTKDIGHTYYAIFKLPNPDGKGNIYHDLVIKINPDTRQIENGVFGYYTRKDALLRR
jgi:hypothetical protein